MRSREEVVGLALLPKQTWSGHVGAVRHNPILETLHNVQCWKSNGERSRHGPPSLFLDSCSKSMSNERLQEFGNVLARLEVSVCGACRQVRDIQDAKCLSSEQNERDRTEHRVANKQ
jgi:hypothetical protein